jgi:hypothetical protein
MTPFGTNTETSCEHFAGIDESKVSPEHQNVKNVKRKVLIGWRCECVWYVVMLAVVTLLKVYMQQDITSKHNILLWLHYLINNGNGAMFINNILDNY